MFVQNLPWYAANYGVVHLLSLSIMSTLFYFRGVKISSHSHRNHIILFIYYLYFTSFCIDALKVNEIKYTADLNELLTSSKNEHDEAIYGNPLLTDQCYNALIDEEHEYNIDNFLEYRGFASPWFWSRESLDATIKEMPLHRRLKVTHTPHRDPIFTLPWGTSASNFYAQSKKGLPAHITRWYDRLGKQTPKGTTYQQDYGTRHDKLNKMNDKQHQQRLPDNIMYYHIEKSGSSSIGSGILSSHDYNHSYISENMISHSICGFTFVREPISRFISAYYTVNRLIYFHNLPGVFKKRYDHDKLFNWFNVDGEPQRFTQFVEDLLEFGFRFAVTSPLEHIMSQSGILSIAQNDIHFVGRLSKLQDHWNKLYEFCDGVQEYPTKEFSRMKNYGTKGIDEHPEYAKMMSLLDYENGDILPAYKVVADSYDLYSKIAQYYKQDFICFGFEMDYIGFRDKIYKKWDEMLERKKNQSPKKPAQKGKGK